MSGMQSFNSAEEMFAYMADQQEKASAATPPKLREMVTWGTHVIAPRPDLGVVIFGRVSTIEDMRKTEDEDTLADLKKAHEDRDRRYGWYYSIIEPAGEPGSHHVVDLYPITQEQFEQAKSVDWEAHSCPWLTEVITKAVRMHREHEANLG